MKIRNGFVSNSSSSSFILSVPNYTNLPIDECIPEIIRDRYNDAIEYNDESDIEHYAAELEKYRVMALSKNVKIFSIEVEYGYEDLINNFTNSIPGLRILGQYEY